MFGCVGNYLVPHLKRKRAKVTIRWECYTSDGLPLGATQLISIYSPKDIVSDHSWWPIIDHLLYAI